jgi:DNA primase
MRFPPQFLDEIRARVNISSVVGRRVQWDRRKSQPGKGDYWACCPFHTEKSPSFHADDRKGRYHCFGCKASGDIFTFLTEKEGASFPEAVERLAAEAGLPMPQVTPEEVEAQAKRASLYDVMEIAAQYFERELQAAGGAKARGYLKDRGLTASMQQSFRMGYAPEGRHGLKTHLAEKGIGGDQMAEAGLVIAGPDIPVAYDRFRDRVMFPIRDPRGRVIAFGGRALSPDVAAKYLNSPETPLFHKGSVLYNLDKARAAAHTAGSIIAVEGYMDVIAMARAGLAQAVAPLGTALTADQLGLLWKIAPEPVLCFDGDGAGLKAAYRAVDLALPLLTPGQSLRIAFLPEGLDPDDLLKSQGADAVKAVIEAAQALIEVLWQRALASNDRSTPERKAQFEREIFALVREIGDERVRGHYQAEMQERLRALWRPQRTGFARSGGNYATNRPQRGPRGQFLAPWEQKLPATAGLKAVSGMLSGAERREQLIVIAVVNHPLLLDVEAESFAGLEFEVAELDRLRHAILETCSSGASLDSSLLRTQLGVKGFGPTLGRIDRQLSRLREWFVLPDAAAADVHTGFNQLIALHEKRGRLARELRAAEQALAEEPTEEKLKILRDIQEQLLSAIGQEASIEGFGDASGRSIPPVA